MPPESWEGVKAYAAQGCDAPLHRRDRRAPLQADRHHIADVTEGGRPGSKSQCPDARRVHTIIPLHKRDQHERRFDYQSECHCSKTCRACRSRRFEFDYQSECHCSKTASRRSCRSWGLITSQNATAPKRQPPTPRPRGSLITSQNATAPKPTSTATPSRPV